MIRAEVHAMWEFRFAKKSASLIFLSFYFLLSCVANGAVPVINSTHTEYSSSGVPNSLRIVGRNLCADSSCSQLPTVKLSQVTLTDMSAHDDREIVVDITAIRDGEHLLQVSNGLGDASFSLKIQVRGDSPNRLGESRSLSNEVTTKTRISRPELPVIPPNDAIDFFKKNSPPYPVESKRLQEEGSVIAEIHVSPTGWASCRIVESSGTKRLDDATIEWCATKSFDAATRDGVPEDYFFKLKYTFRLESEDSCGPDVKIAADGGDSDAQVKIGLCYLLGRNSAEDMTLAASWFRKAAEKGNSDGQTWLGSSYIKGWGVPRDYVEGKRWLKKAANSDNPMAACVLGIFYYQVDSDRDYQEAAKWLRISASRGFAKAQGQMGFIYREGIGVVKDYQEAARWFRLGAEQGDGFSQTSLAGLYLDGRGVEKNIPEGVRLATIAARNGDSFGQALLGTLYLRGVGVPKIEKAAVDWMRLAAQQDNINAQAMMGIFYAGGIAVEKNPFDAYKWMYLAESNEESSIYNSMIGQFRDLISGLKVDIKSVKGKLSVAQIKRAETTAAECRKIKFVGCM